jgi:hypothetical protein
MTKSEAKPAIAAVNQLFSNSADGLREIVRAVMQEMLEAEMTDALGAEKSERTTARLGYRPGYYTRTLITRVGKLELRVPQDRNGHFSSELFERYQRSEQALVAALAEMYVQGSRPARSRRSPRSCVATPFRPRPSPPSTSVWTKASKLSPLLGLRRRGLNGVEFVVADDHAGLRSAVREVLPEAAFQRCSVHFLRNALDHLPRKADDDCLQELRWLYDRRSVEEARGDLAAWGARLPKARRLGRGQHRRDAHLLPPASPAPQTSQEQQTCSNASTRRSDGAPMSCASSPTQPPAAVSSARSPSKLTRTGSRPTDTST